MKRPAFQFYPADWRKDAELQSCSLEARGLWIEAMCIAHECEPYGHLTINGKAMSAAQLGRLIGATARDTDRLLAELIHAGVASRSDDGAIFSRRMWRDEDLRNRRAAGGHAGAEHGAKGAEAGKKGGRPPKRTGDSEPPLEPPPSSSSSSSASAKEEGRAESIPPGVARAPEEPEPERQPTRAGAACLAMRRAGLTSVNPGDPRLLALLEQGATDEELAAMAGEAAAKGKGWGWVLAAVQGRRSEAAAISLAPPPAQTVPSSDAERTRTLLDAEADHRRIVEEQRVARQARKREAA